MFLLHFIVGHSVWTWKQIEIHGIKKNKFNYNFYNDPVFILMP